MQNSLLISQQDILLSNCVLVWDMLLCKEED